MTADVAIFLQAVAATAAFINGVFFYRYWRESHDRLFWFFSLAFALLALSWTLLALFSPTQEARPYLHAVRLVAFLLIITGIVRKNLNRS